MRKQKFILQYRPFYFAAAMKKGEDTYMHKGLRRRLISLLRDKGIRDERVLNAMNAIPRHWFLDSAFGKIAYEDRAFPIAADQTISQPYTVAYQTELLGIKRHELVLEIGTGSTYQATILAEMGARVYTIERQRKLYNLQKSNYLFRDKYPNLTFCYGDGYEGLPGVAPFDKILITAAAPFIPPKLIDQLRVGGVMVIPVDEGKDNQRMLRITKLNDGLETETFDNFSFVPMLTGKNS